MQAWESFLVFLEGRFGKETIDKWVRSLNLVKFDAANLYLQTKDSFQISWFEEQIRPYIKTHLRNNNNREIKVHLSQLSSSSKKEQQKTKISHSFPILADTINSSFSFDNFCIDSSNEMAYQALFQLSECKENKIKLATFNPIYLYGDSGVGKTHLLHAFASSLMKKGFNVLFVKTETFTTHVVRAIRSGSMESFRKIYRNIDVLIIDDIHHLSKKFATQEEFFHTFNTLHTLNKQILISANSSPQHLSDIEPRLISRFEWGISIALGPLSKEKLSSVLQKKKKQLQLPLCKEAEEFLMQIFKGNILSIQKAYEALALRLPDPSPDIINVVLTKSLIKDLIEKAQEEALSPEKIMKTIASYYGITINDILGDSHVREYSIPRQFSMYFCRIFLKLPFLKIGALFQRDHSTVMTSVKQIQKAIDSKHKDIYFAFLDLSKRIGT